MKLTQLVTEGWDDKTVWQDGEFSLVKTVDSSPGMRGRNPQVVWEPRWGDVTLDWFKSKKLAMLALQMIIDGKIRNTEGKADLQAVMHQWYIDNDKYDEIPNGL